MGKSLELAKEKRKKMGERREKRKHWSRRRGALEKRKLIKFFRLSSYTTYSLVSRFGVVLIRVRTPQRTDCCASSLCILAINQCLCLFLSFANKPALYVLLPYSANIQTFYALPLLYTALFFFLPLYNLNNLLF